MPKVMLVEDDNNLREIYDARLAAEGYEIVSAHDGEEALALAVKERPDLIISDVMMPKISGFDMLDILRSTPETKNTKVIMMTALGQAEDRERADKLGADRYLVKSQVTLEDVIKVAHEVLGDVKTTNDTPAAASNAPVADLPVVAAPPAATPVADTPTPAVVPTPEPTPPPAAAPAPVSEPSVAPTPPPPVQATVPTEPPTDPAATVTVTPDAPPVIEATHDASPAPVLEVPVTPPTPTSAPAAPAAEPITDDMTKTEAAETDGVEQQIQDFITNSPSINDTPEPPAATPTVELPTSAPAAPPTQDQLANPSVESTANTVPEPPSHKKLVLTPTDNALAPSVDINALLEKENLKDGEAVPVETPAATTVIAPNPNDVAL